VAGLSLVLLVGCSASSNAGGDATGGESSAPEPPQNSELSAPSTEISCGANIGGSDPDTADWTIVDDVVALPSTDNAALQAVEVAALDSAPGESDVVDENWWWTKHGLVVKGTARVALEVPSEHIADMRIGWGSGPAVPVASVTVDCDPPMDFWLAFPGGYWVKEPGCYPIDVRVDDGPARQVHLDFAEALVGAWSPTWKYPRGRHLPNWLMRPMRTPLLSADC
jgi:hypothetical protein